MGVEIGGIIEEMHEDEKGRRIIDKVKIEYLSLVPDNGVMDALEFLGDDYIVRMPPVREYTVRAKIKSVEKGIPCFVEDECCGLKAWQSQWNNDECFGCRYGSCESCPVPGDSNSLYMEFRDWDELSDEALEEFEKLVEESEPGTFWDKIRYWTLSDWIDWLKGD